MGRVVQLRPAQWGQDVGHLQLEKKGTHCFNALKIPILHEVAFYLLSRI